VSTRNDAPRNKKFNLLLLGDIKTIQEAFIDTCRSELLMPQHWMATTQHVSGVVGLIWGE
jgi:hypothetical protein